MTVSIARRAQLLATVMLSLVVLIGPLRQATANIGEGSDAIDRQQLVYELNMARWNPVAYASVAHVRWDEWVARPPLALNDQLLGSAQLKADEMAVYGYFAHRSEATGLWPNQLARNAGYPLTSDFRVEANNVESLHSGSPVAFDVLTSFAKSPTHRRHLFGENWFENHREIGVGRSAIDNFWAVHTAFQSDTRPRLTGVVFADSNGNSRMDLGEGLPGVTVIVDDRVVVTNVGGGYSIDVDPGSHLITSFGGSFEGVSSAKVEVGSYNVGADFVSGTLQPVVRAYELCEGLEPTILGTGGDDVLKGTPGRDVIHGLGGRDLIDGQGGDDVICRGEDQPRVNLHMTTLSLFHPDWQFLPI